MIKIPVTIMLVFQEWAWQTKLKKHHIQLLTHCHQVPGSRWSYLVAPNALIPRLKPGSALRECSILIERRRL